MSVGVGVGVDVAAGAGAGAGPGRTWEAEVAARVLAGPRLNGAGEVAAAVRRHAREVAPLLDGPEFQALVERCRAQVLGLGPLEALLADPLVTDVLVNGGRDVWVERAGALSRLPQALEPGVAELLIERVVAPLGLRADPAHPLVDARLPDGSRVHAVLPPLAVDGACLSIRRFGAATLPAEAFCAGEVADFLRGLVAAGANIVVSGGTSSGKTTLANALAAAIPTGERIVTIEDAAELRLPGDHVVRLEARPGGPDGPGPVTIRDLVRAALRMRPDRIVVGEVRGPEVFDMLTAMNTGHEGSLSTCHANGPADALRRIEAMVVLAVPALPLDAVREHVHAALDVVIQVSRGHGGARRITEVVELSAPGAAGERVHVLATGDAMVAAPRRPPRRSAVGAP